MDLGTLIMNLQSDGTIATIARNPLAQFGAKPRRYIGAELLVDRPVADQMYREENIRYRTVIANNGTRYSPVQKKRGELMGSFEVVLGYSDIGREFSGKDFDNLLKLVNANSEAAMIGLTNWVDLGLVRALAELREKQRWEAIVNAQVVATGDNGFSETVNYSNPSGHRVNAAGTWSDDTYDPFSDIVAIMNMLHNKGYTVSRIITRRPVISILSMNAKVRQRVGINTISTGGQLTAAPGYASLEAINTVLQKDGLPPLEEYNLRYRVQGTDPASSSSPFIPGNCMVFVCQTGRDELLDLGDSVKQVTDLLGYTAVGTCVGQDTPGPVIKLFPYENKPPRIEGEGYQSSVPVITEPEAIAVIKNIA